MDVDRFDGLTRTLATTGTRRGLLQLVAALPLAGGLVTRLTEGAYGAGGNGNGAIIRGPGRRRRRNRHRHNPGQHKDNRKGKRNQCKPESKARTCGRKCGKVRNNCGKRVDCGACLVFVTSSLRNGNLGGLNGADAICQDRAQAGGLPGTYRAWLSDDTGSPSTRFRCTAASCSGEGYRLPDQAQTQIATDWTDLTDGDLIHAINVTELGGTVPASPAPEAFAWTNTTPDGTAGIQGFDCSDWTIGIIPSPAPDPFPFGTTGFALSNGGAWTQAASSPCDVPRRLYCFQQ